MTRALLVLAGVALSASAHAAQPDAATPAPVAPAAAAAVSRLPAAPLGRLFFAPGERAQLDVARLQKKAPAASSSTAPEVVEAPPVPQVVTYGGLVRRSDGRQMLWLNNRLVDEKEALAGLNIKGRIRPDGAVTLQAQSGATVDVKVGQSVELYTGKVAEMRKPPPEPMKPQDGKVPANDGKPAPVEARDTAPDSRGAPVAAKPPAPDNADKKPQPSGTGVKMDLGNRALSSEEAARISGTR